MLFSVARLEKHHINDGYLSTLNDPEYMRFSQHKNKIATFESQCKYLMQFDFYSSFALAIMDPNTSKLLATATFQILNEKTPINIGILVLKDSAGKGLGKKILRELSAWIFQLFPLRSQQIGTLRENIGMQKISEAAGFSRDEETQNSDYIYFIKHNPLMMQLSDTRWSNFHIVSNDAGGALQLSALANALFPKATATLSGPAVEIFARESPAIADIDILSEKIAQKSILLGSSFYGGKESELLESNLLGDNEKVVLLDHWVNYRERFAPKNPILPDSFFVTNTVANELARKNFPNSPIKEIPDFLLAKQKKEYLRGEASVDSVVLILEPDAVIGEGLNFIIGNLEDYLPVIVDFCLSHDLKNIILRSHPSRKLNLELKLHDSYRNINIIRSSGRLLTEDLLRAKAVFGFHSSALYASAMIGVKTYSFFAGAEGHWTKYFPEILEIS